MTDRLYPQSQEELGYSPRTQSFAPKPTNRFEHLECCRSSHARHGASITISSSRNRVAPCQLCGPGHVSLFALVRGSDTVSPSSMPIDQGGTVLQPFTRPRMYGSAVDRSASRSLLMPIGRQQLRARRDSELRHAQFRSVPLDRATWQ
jgi:hypothetical protein